MIGAASHLLGLMRRDPRLAFLIGPGSEAFDRLTADYAAAQGMPVEAVRERLAKALPQWTGEALEWHDASLRKPDAELTVLCWHADDEEFWTGYWDGAGWIGCESGGSVLGITHWALPRGPR